MPVLADAMQRAGVHNSMLLDINPTHAHFTAMRVEDGELVVVGAEYCLATGLVEFF